MIVFLRAIRGVLGYQYIGVRISRSMNERLLRNTHTNTTSTSFPSKLGKYYYVNIYILVHKYNSTSINAFSISTQPLKHRPQTGVLPSESFLCIHIFSAFYDTLRP